MRILHLIHRFYPGRGGAESHLEELSARLVEAGHEVTIATGDALDVEGLWAPGHRRISTGAAVVRGISVHYFPIRHLPLTRLTYPALRLLAAAIASLPGGLPAAHRLARWTPCLPALWPWLAAAPAYDVVGASTITFEGVLEAARFVAQKQGIPLIIFPHTHLGAGPRPGKDRLSRFYTLPHQIDLLRQADHVSASTATERDFLASQGIPAGKLSVFGPGINPKLLAGGDGRRWRAEKRIEGVIVAALGATTREKGIPHLVEAMGRLWAAGETAELVLAGTVLSDFQAFLDRLPAAVRRRIHLLGAISDEEKRDLLAAADLFCLPSRTESFGIVYLEAWLSGLPVVGARTWGIRGDLIVEGENGLLVEFGDIAGLEAVLRQLIHDPAQRRRLGENGRRRTLEEHTWERKFAGLHAIYRALGERQLS